MFRLQTLCHKVKYCNYMIYNRIAILFRWPEFNRWKFFSNLELFSSRTRFVVADHRDVVILKIISVSSVKTFDDLIA